MLLLSGCSIIDNSSNIDCGIDAGPCVSETDGTKLKVIFDINPKPVAAMKKLTFTVRLENGAAAVTDADVVADLTMPGMYMNDNRVRLTHTADGLYSGEGVIVRCAGGNKVWKADVSVSQPGLREGRPLRTSFRFRVGR
jgi:hypothetical protein